MNIQTVVVPMLMVISGGSLIQFVVTLVIGALIFFVINWALDQFAVAEPFNKIIKVVVVLAIALFLINALMGLNGAAFIHW